MIFLVSKSVSFEKWRLVAIVLSLGVLLLDVVMKGK
jgi:hypothetical protein